MNRRQIEAALGRMRQGLTAAMLAQAEIQTLLADEPRPDDAIDEAVIRDHLRQRMRELGILQGADGRLSSADAARLVDRTTRTLARWRDEGRLIAATVSGRPRVTIDDLAGAIAGELDAG